MENELAVNVSTAEENTAFPEDNLDVVSNDDGEDLSTSDKIDIESERAEYERLIRTRFKSFYTEDTQKMINKRFKKYKALEDKLRDMEETAKQSEARIAEIDALVISERERIEREAEQRITSRIIANKSRANENAVSERHSDSGFDVSRLTKGERAALASRALRGEKIAF
jgi:septal ring factor EnvC (AmiA/AmiB activator)